MPELVDELVRLSVVVQAREPVDQLAVAVIESPAPLPGLLPLDLREYAGGGGVLHLDHQVLSQAPIADDDVRGKVAEERELIGKMRPRADAGRISSRNADTCSCFLKKGWRSFRSDRLGLDFKSL